jgi:hypothetical protein
MLDANQAQQVDGIVGNWVVISEASLMIGTVKSLTLRGERWYYVKACDPPVIAIRAG